MSETASADRLDERKATILKAIVEEYVNLGEPVGSRRLVDQWSFGVSAATVRAEMAALEEAGYITHPHTSAGRVPTDKGYRFFVDAMTSTVPLGATQRKALEDLLVQAADLEELLRRASGVLSRLTRFAAVVAAPRLDRSRLRHIELVHLGPNSVMAILIADTGRVEKRMLDLEAAVADHDVQRTRHAVNDAAAGLRLPQAADVITGLANGAPAELRPLVDAVADAVRQGASGDLQGEQVFVGGTANIAEAGYFDRLEQVKQVYETLEEQVVLLRMLHDALDTGDPAVRIGHELSLEELASCAVVASRYEVPGSAAGSIGVLGPTRMDYRRTLSAVQAVASSVEKALAALTGATPPRGDAADDPPSAHP